MSTPLYDELVVKYYLSQGIKPFSYPHEPVGLNAVPKVKIRVGDLNGNTVGQYIDLITRRAVETGQPQVVAQQKPKYEYFRL